MDELVLETDTLAERQAAFQLWTDTVRDPAQRASEGVRELIVLDRAATARYEIAPLPEGRWAITVGCEYHCGHCHGAGIPWTEFPGRDECIEFFQNTARHHFGQHIGFDGSDLQRKAQAEMNRLLKGGLFGFIEPTPSQGHLIDSDISHDSTWETARHELVCPKEAEYFDVPRGRIVWDTVRQSGILYHGNATPTGVFEELARHFRLPRWEARLDEHYLTGEALEAFYGLD